jgi:hypothetical protein
MSDDEEFTQKPVQHEQHIQRLIAALKGSSLAAAWWEFKKGGSAGSGDCKKSPCDWRA